MLLLGIALVVLAQPGQLQAQEPGDLPSGSPYVRSGSCGGRSGFPVSLEGSQAACPPYRQPAIFIAAHPDDETIGMAGAIREAVQAGRTVVVELMTRGTESKARWKVCWHAPIACPKKKDDFGDARVREFLDSMKRLGVTAVQIHDRHDGELAAAEVSERIEFWKRNGGPGVSFAGPAGHEDQAYHPDHGAVADAITQAGTAGSARYQIYRYRDPERSRTAKGRIPLTAEVCATKQDALRAYSVWDPARGRFAVGKFSTPELFQAASEDCAEYRL